MRAALAEHLPEAASRRLERVAFNRAVAHVRGEGGACCWGSPRLENYYRSAALSLIRNAPAIAARAPGGTADELRAAGALPPAELRPELWAELVASLEARELEADALPESNTSAYKCRMCGSRECNYQQIQTRSGDEMASVFVTCLVCRNRWRVC